MKIHLPKRLPVRAFAAAATQVLQAVGSFGIQIAAAWSLGAGGLGMVSLALGIIVLATALVSGLIGDSLVILERDKPSVRGALQALALGVSLASSVVTSAVLAVTSLTPSQAILFGLAMLSFQLEELLRRVFMATMLYFRLMILDGAVVVASLSVIGIWSLLGQVSLEAFFIALISGQLAGLLSGLALLPPQERYWAPMRHTRIREVATFGMWRGAQVSMNPLVMAVVRSLVTVFVGPVALGLVEGARIFVAPSTLVVQGLGSYLLSGYVRDKAKGAAPLVSRARQASLGLVGLALVSGAVLVLAAPYIGQLVSGNKFNIDRLTVSGWALYVVGSASFQPFASLSAVLGRQQRVFGCRMIDATLTILALALVLGLGADAALTPYVMAAGLGLGGFLVRALVLHPLVEEDAEQVQLAANVA